MCIAVTAQHLGGYRFVLASNRDEWLDRPSEAMRWWKPDGINEVLSGQDLEAGGTWLGLTRAGRIALVTNVRQSLNAQATYPKSRGQLPMAWLLSQASSAEFADQLNRTKSEYAGFNLLFGHINEGLHFTSNRSEDRERLETVNLSAQVIYGLSNASLDTPWPKVVALKAALETTIHSQKERTESFTASLEVALLNEQTHDGSPLSAINVDAPNFAGTAKRYGRRCSTLIAVDVSGDVLVTEIQRENTRNSFAWKLSAPWAQDTP
jgi:uncharacterized protein with NRDE domain